MGSTCYGYSVRVARWLRTVVARLTPGVPRPTVKLPILLGGAMLAASEVQAVQARLVDFLKYGPWCTCPVSP